MGARVCVCDAQYSEPRSASFRVRSQGSDLWRDSRDHGCHRLYHHAGMGDALPLPDLPLAPRATLRHLRYDSRVAKQEPNFDLTCPCCGAVMKVDVSTKSVI